MNAQNVKEVIESFSKYENAKSKNVFLGEEITDKILALHEKRYADVSADESPLLAVNKSIMGTVGGYGWSGMLITDRKLYFKCIADTFFSSLYSKSNKGSFLLEEIQTIAIGEHDHCFGTAYMGHQLIINGNVVGLLRMGGGIELDETAINELSKIFNTINQK